MKTSLRTLLAICAISGALWAPASALAAEPTAMPTLRGPIHQLRIYELFDGNKQLFHDRFRDHAARIMARHGFKIVAIWETRHDKRTEFAYLLEWPDKPSMDKAWAGFKADPEWADIKKATNKEGSPLLGDIEDRTLELVNYSPNRKLLR